MAHVRILRHYIHTPYLMMALCELLLLVFGSYLGSFTRHQEFPPLFGYLLPALGFALVMLVSMISMGVYESRVREGYVAMMLRTSVSIFLLGSMAVAVLSYLLPVFDVGRGVLLFSAIESFVLIAVFRWATVSLVKENSLKKRVIVLGIGQRAKKIASRMRRKADQRAFLLLGFVGLGNQEDCVSEFGANVLEVDESLLSWAKRQQIDEIVVALDERRRNREPGSPGLPIDELMECRLDGIEVCDVQAFMEREAGKVDVDLLQPSWMVFSDGFVSNAWRDATKRAFDIFASSLLLFVVWPFMLLIAFCIGVGSRFKDPILYRQIRVGLNNEPFEVLKFRSMRVDAEAHGAVWAAKDDPRVTRLGEFMRRSRIDELPQLFNVLRGEMSFVGPRPERPVFVDELSQVLPYYEHRHRVKPGITGWAQLCYPYGASVEDAKEKLQYDLYYLKNHSILLDLIILLQTVEVVLVGDGAR